MEGRACAIAQRNLTAGEWRRYIGSNAGLTCPAFPVAKQQPVASYGADGEPTATATPPAAAPATPP
jgi:hypothetical protein